MSLDSPPYLTSLQNSLRARPIPWEGAVRMKVITDHDLKRIKAVDKVRKEQRKTTVEKEPEQYTSLLLGGGQNERSVLETAAKRPDVLQYILVLTGDLINDVPDFSKNLLEHSDPFKPFLPLLTHSPNPEEPIPILSSSVLAKLISKAQSGGTKWTSKTDEALKKLFDYLGKLSQSQDSGLQDIAVQGYSSVLRSHHSRQVFWKQRKETLAPLVDILRSAGGVDKDGGSTLMSGAASIRTTVDSGIGGGVSLQLLYHVLLVIWQFSYEAEDVGQEFNEEHEVIALYTHLLRLSPKEKTTRLILSTILNLIEANKSALLPVATSVRLPALIAVLKTRHLNDEDLAEDLKALDEMLADYTSAQTTLDEYASELKAGHLRWSPPHKDPSFWSENAEKILTENKSELAKQLADILGKGWDSDKQVLAVGCNDIGWLVKTCPEKRSVLEKLGVKARVMELMADSNEAVRWESLKAVGEWMRYSFGSN